MADECVSGHIVRSLRAHGHDVVWIKESQPGVSDEEVLQQSVTDSRILLTEDRGLGEQAVRFEKPALGVAALVTLKVGELKDNLIGRLTILERHRVRHRELVNVVRHPGG